MEKEVNDKLEEIKARIKDIEGLLGGTVKTPGLVHLQREMAQTIYGKNGNDGLVKEVYRLKMDRVKFLYWVGGAWFAGSTITGVIILVMKQWI